MSFASFRRDFISRPIFRWARRVLPHLSDTEREAIEAGDVWWDADLFSGDPDWATLLAFPPARLSTRSIAGAVTAMVPNSLGPGELLLRFGTKEQQGYWLPRLAEAKEIPCFGLTSPEAGSDAASMIDSGVVCRGTWQGREILGIK